MQHLMTSKMFRNHLKPLSRGFRTYSHVRRSSSTVDFNEINKFDQCSDPNHDWYSSDVMKPLRLMNQLRIPLIKNQLLINDRLQLQHNGQPLDKINLLDVGCGGGLLSIPLARLGAKVTALDANPNAINCAQKHVQKYEQELIQRIDFQCGTLEQLCFQKSNQFDAVIASEILEHVDNIDLLIKSMYQVLKPKGKLIITTINQSVFAYLAAILLAENVLNISPKGTHSYDKLVLVNGLELILRENGFQVDLIHGMCYNPITEQWSWTTNTSINYALVATKS